MACVCKRSTVVLDSKGDPIPIPPRSQSSGSDTDSPSRTPPRARSIAYCEGDIQQKGDMMALADADMAIAAAKDIVTDQPVPQEDQCLVLSNPVPPYNAVAKAEKTITMPQIMLGGKQYSFEPHVTRPRDHIKYNSPIRCFHSGFNECITFQGPDVRGHLTKINAIIDMIHQRHEVFKIQYPVELRDDLQYTLKMIKLNVWDFNGTRVGKVNIKARYYPGSDTYRVEYHYKKKHKSFAMDEFINNLV